MAKENNYQNLAQVDYCIRQYFSKYMAPTLVKEVRNLREKQTEEFINRLEKNESPFVPVDVQLQNADNQLKVCGKWYKKSSDDIIRQCKHRWGKIPNLPRIIRHFLIPSIRNSSDKMGVNLQRNLQPLQKTMWQIDFRDLSLSSWPERKFPRTVLPTLQERHLMTVYWDCFQNRSQRR